MKHTPKTAARAVRVLLERTSRIAKTWEDYHAEHAYRMALPPAQRPDGAEWANAYQAYRLAAEQLCGAGRQPTDEQSKELQKAIGEVMPELFAEYWEALPL